MAGIAEELSQLADLQKQGVLTPEEFEQQKARLLRGGDAPPANAPATMAPNRGAVIAGVTLLVVVVALAGAYASSMFGRSHTGSTAPIASSQAISTASGSAASGSSAPGSSAPPEFGSTMDDAHRPSTAEAIPAWTILAAFKADPVAAQAQYGHPVNFRAAVLKVSSDAVRIDAGDPNLRVIAHAMPGDRVDPAMIGHVVVGKCQAPQYPNVDGEQMMIFDHCTFTPG